MAGQKENKRKISDIINEVNMSLETLESDVEDSEKKCDVCRTEELQEEPQEEASGVPFHGNTQIVLVLRVIVAGYLFYTSYSLVKGYTEGSSIPLWGLVLSVTVFSLFAIVVGGLALKALVKGEYIGGKADTTK